MKKTIILVFLATALAVLSPFRMSAQIANPQCEELFTAYRAKYQSATVALQSATDDAARQAAIAAQQENRRLFAQLLNVNTQPGCVVSMILAANPAKTREVLSTSLFLGFVSSVEKQAGSSSGTSGSTSLVSKNFTSRLLSLADEYGALTSSTSGQTTTVSGSLDQLFNAIEGASKGVFTECAVKTIPGAGCVNSGFVSFLGRVSYSTSLDLNQPSTITGTATGTASGTAQQVTGTQGGNSFALSQFTSKFFLWAAKPTKQQLLDELTKSGDIASSPAREKLVKIQKAAGENQGGAWLTWLEGALPVLLSSSEGSVNNLATQEQKLVAVLVAGGTAEKDVIQAALDYSGSVASVADAERTLYDKVAWSKPILTFEYDYNTPSNQPTNSTFRLIWGQSLKNWKLTGNAAGSIYNSTPSSLIPHSGRLRDLQVGIEADRDPYNIGNLLTATFSAAFYFQDQTSPAILNVTPNSPVSGVMFTGLPSNATQVFTQKGKIDVGQLKITLASKNSSSGWKFPIAITGSNRTELITKSTFGAQVGISYDFDSLLK